MIHPVLYSTILDGNPYNGPSAIMVKGKLDTGSKGGLIHNTWYWLVTLNLVVTLNWVLNLGYHLSLLIVHSHFARLANCSGNIIYHYQQQLALSAGDWIICSFLDVIRIASYHTQCIISAPSVHHQSIMSALLVHHHCIIRASSGHQKHIISK